MSATGTEGDQIAARDQMINDGGASRDGAASSLTQNTVGQKVQSAALATQFVPGIVFEKDLKNDFEGVSVVTARNS